MTNFPGHRFWVDYDAEVDVLCVSFQRPQQATNSIMTDEGIILHYRGSQLVGVTIMGASTWQPT